MSQSDPCFIGFNHSISDYSLPKRFTFPFYYQPDPLCVLAVTELQHYLNTQQKWQHNFGLGPDKTNASGKMFGVLLVENQQKEIGYLTAFSGRFCGTYTLEKFVPPIPEMKKVNSLLEGKQDLINNLNHKIVNLENNPDLQRLQAEIQKTIQAFNIELVQHQTIMAENRKRRKQKRLLAEQTLQSNKLSTDNLTTSLADTFSILAKESVNDKNQLKALKLNWQKKIDTVQIQLNELTNKITLLKNERQNRSATLQDKIFQQYKLLNSKNGTNSLQAIFKTTPQQVPPSGSGDCAAPKMIQHAFKHNYKILAMAEFWWGMSPKSEIRQHKNFYPACSGKCEPILNWMLKGIELDENPLLKNTAHAKQLEILYQDEALAIINKPNELLSVPGNNIKDSVHTRIKQLIPSASGPIIVHRLDMSTSGLMVIALTKRAHKQLQKQFIQRTVKKRYIALLSGAVKQKSGEITLPLKGDFYNRPRQLVCEQEGKPAETTWEVIEYTTNQQTKMYLTPKTGRTHQLRVHCAHPSGLNMPIVGDDLYGIKDKRLHLHAEKITFLHPITQKEVTFQSFPNF